MGLIFNGNGDVIKAVDGSLTVEGLDFEGGGNVNAGIVTGTSANFTGNVSVGGVLTYEDVKNVDSVGVITARNGIRVGASGTKRETVHLDAGDSGANYLRFTNTTTGNGVADGFNVGINADENVLLWNFENKDTIFATNNAERVRIDSAGLFGVGTSTLEQRLNIHEADSDGCFLKVTNSTTGTGNNDGALFGITAAEAAVIWQRENNIIQLATNNTERFRIDSSGNVWLNYANPTSSGTLIIDKDGSGEAGLRFYNAGSNTAKIALDSGENLTFDCHGSERVRIKSDGKIGIATDNPATDVHIEGTAPVLTVRANNASSGFRVNIKGQSTGQLFRVQDEGTTKFVLEESGDVGIGTETPLRHLHLHNSSSAATSVRFTHPSVGGLGADVGITASGDIALWHNNAGKNLILGTNNLERARITSLGSLIVGNQTSTSYKLCVSEAAHTRIEVISTSNNSAGLWLKTFNGGSIVSQSTIRTSNDGNLELYAGTSSEMRRFWIDASNAAYLQGTSHTNFEVRSNSASTKAIIQTVQDSDVRIGATTNHPLALYAGQNERLRLDTSGRLLAGTTSNTDSNERLNITHPSDYANNVITFSTQPANTVGNATVLNFRDKGGISGQIIARNSAYGSGLDNALQFLTSTSSNNAPTVRMTLNEQGKVLINTTTNPYDTRALTVNLVPGQSNNYISIIGATNGVSGLTFGDSDGQAAGNYAGMFEYYHSGDYLTYKQAGNERMRLYAANSSNAGIVKFTSPNSGDMLNLQNSTSGGQGLIFGVDTGNGYSYWKNNTSGSYDAAFIVGGSERLRIKSGGDIEVGEKIVHMGDTDTYLHFQNNTFIVHAGNNARINANSNMLELGGTRQFNSCRQYQTNSNSSWTTILTFSTPTAGFSMECAGQENSYSTIYRVSGSAYWNSCYYTADFAGDSSHAHSSDLMFRVTNTGGTRTLEFKANQYTTTRLLTIISIWVKNGYVTWS